MCKIEEPVLDNKRSIELRSGGGRSRRITILLIPLLQGDHQLVGRLERLQGWRGRVPALTLVLLSNHLEHGLVLGLPLVYPGHVVRRQTLGLGAAQVTVGGARGGYACGHGHWRVGGGATGQQQISGCT